MKTMHTNRLGSARKNLLPGGARAVTTKEIVTIPVTPAQLSKRKFTYNNISYKIFKPSTSSYFSTLKTKPIWNENLYGPASLR